MNDRTLDAENFPADVAEQMNEQMELDVASEHFADHHKHPMAAHLYDRMADSGYDMTHWERIEEPKGQPVYKVLHFSNRAMRRAAAKEGRTKGR